MNAISTILVTSNRIGTMNKLKFLGGALHSENDKQKSFARLLSVLEWIFRWRYTTPEIIKALLQTNNNHHYRCIQRWEHQQLIRRSPMPHPIIRNVIILTNRGVELLQSHSDSLIENVLLDKTKISYATLQHTIAVQDYAATIMTPDRRFSSEHELRSMQQPGRKVPDFMALSDDNRIASFEIELSSKSALQTEISVSHSLDMLANEETELLFYLSSSKAILKKYEQLFNRNTIPIWVRNTGYGQWFKSDEPPHYPRHYAGRISLGYDEVDRFKRFVG